MASELRHEEARAYIDRWQLVRSRQREEARLMPVEERFGRLAMLMRVRRRLSDPGHSTDDGEVRDRWQRLREILLA